MPRVRSKHSNLLNYFIHDKRDLSPAYVASCEKFLKEISLKLQAPSLTGPLGDDRMNLERNKYEYKK